MKHMSKDEYRKWMMGRLSEWPEVYIEDVDPEQVYLDQMGLCLRCKEEIVDSYHLDHMIPLGLGGMHERSNIQALHVRCHKRKTAIADRQLRIALEEETKLMAGLIGKQMMADLERDLLGQ